jgi:hypothetical protein
MVDRDSSAFFVLSGAGKLAILGGIPGVRMQ